MVTVRPENDSKEKRKLVKQIEPPFTHPSPIFVVVSVSTSNNWYVVYTVSL